MSIPVLSVMLFGTLVVCLLSGFPVAFGLGSTAILYSLILWGPQSLLLGAYTFYELMWSFLFIAIPLFILMGHILAESGIAEDLFTSLHFWLGEIRGGLAMALVVVGAIMGAMVGMIGAAIFTLGAVSLPAMTKRGYNREIQMGTLMASASLAALIPPSCAMMIYAAVTEVSIGKMFVGGVIPGVMLAALYITFIGVRTGLKPELAPPIAVDERANLRQKVSSLKSIVLPTFLIVSVIGSIFFGVATPSEAASVGVVGAVICAAIKRRLTWQTVKSSLVKTMKLHGMIIWIALGARIFNRFYIAMGAPHLIEDSISRLRISPWWVVISMQVILLLLGMVMDDWPMIMIAGPIFHPIVVALGFDPLWFGILFMINLQMAVLTPPFGFNLFYAKAMVPEESMAMLWRSIVPFVLLQMVALALVMVFPQLILWLPSLMFRT